MARTVPIKNESFQSFLLLLLIGFFVAQFFLLNPSRLEEDFGETRTLTPPELLSFIQNQPSPQIVKLTQNAVPNYALRDLVFLSTDAMKRNWKLEAEKSWIYSSSATTSDSQGGQPLMFSRDLVFSWKEGTLSAKEGVARQNTGEIELFGDVVVRLKSGLVVESNYGRILTQPHTEIQIPIFEPVRGYQSTKNTRTFEFESMGLNYVSKPEESLKLLSESRVRLLGKPTTQVDSDFANFRPEQDRIDFEMSKSRPLVEQFVRSSRDQLVVHSRNLWVQLKKQKVQELWAVGDTRFSDTTNTEHPVRGTAGKMRFVEKTNLLFLMDFPQVYQDNDTVTGELIRYDRNLDTIEVEQSNAYNRR